MQTSRRVLWKRVAAIAIMAAALIGMGIASWMRTPSLVWEIAFPAVFIVGGVVVVKCLHSFRDDRVTL